MSRRLQRTIYILSNCRRSRFVEIACVFFFFFWQLLQISRCPLVVVEHCLEFENGAGMLLLMLVLSAGKAEKNAVI